MVGLFAKLHDETVAILFDDRLHIGLFAFFAGEDERFDQRYTDVAVGGVGAFDGAGPYPGDDGELFPQIGLQVGALRHHLGGYLHFRVEMADAFVGLFAHPVAVAPHILRQPFGAAPILMEPRPGALRLRHGAHGLAAGEFWRYLYHRLVYHHRHGIEIAGVAFEPQPLRLQGYRPASCEGVVKSRKLLGVEPLLAPVHLAGLPPASSYRFSGALEHLFVVGIFPLHQVANDVEKPLPLQVRLGFGLAGIVAALPTRVVDHLGKEHRPRRRQRTPRPP